MLIRNAELYGVAPGSGRDARTDVRLKDGRIAAVGQLAAEPSEQVIDAAGGALLPGLHDHHIHLLGYAASLNSVRCGPPAVSDAGDVGDCCGDLGVFEHEGAANDGVYQVHRFPRFSKTRRVE